MEGNEQTDLARLVGELENKRLYALEHGKGNMAPGDFVYTPDVWSDYEAELDEAWPHILAGIRAQQERIDVGEGRIVTLWTQLKEQQEENERLRTSLSSALKELERERREARDVLTDTVDVLMERDAALDQVAARDRQIEMMDVTLAEVRESRERAEAVARAADAYLYSYEGTDELEAALRVWKGESV